MVDVAAFVYNIITMYKVAGAQSAARPADTRASDHAQIMFLETGGFRHEKDGIEF